MKIYLRMLCCILKLPNFAVHLIPFEIYVSHQKREQKFIEKLFKKIPGMK